MRFKDLFTPLATDYARFRPRYPPALFAWLAEVAPARELAVDVGAGNGQAAGELAKHFARVIAVEPSAAQLANAPALPGVTFRLGSAEALGLDGERADLIACAQAFHWFRHDAFFAEVERVLRPGGCLAVWCYGNARISPAVDEVVHELDENRLGRYWEPELALVERGYRDIAVPFPEIPSPSFDMRLDWTLEHLVGYLRTWSALRRYVEVEGRDPLDELLPRLRTAWGTGETRPVAWPIAMRAFRR